LLLFCLLIEGVSFATGLLLKPAGVCVWERTQAWSREYTGAKCLLTASGDTGCKVDSETPSILSQPAIGHVSFALLKAGNTSYSSLLPTSLDFTFCKTKRGKSKDIRR
jgi:hypothetical protein